MITTKAVTNPVTRAPKQAAIAQEGKRIPSTLTQVVKPVLLAPTRPVTTHGNSVRPAHKATRRASEPAPVRSAWPARSRQAAPLLVVMMQGVIQQVVMVAAVTEVPATKAVSSAMVMSECFTATTSTTLQPRTVLTYVCVCVCV